jgi:hypothetical protein
MDTATDPVPEAPPAVLPAEDPQVQEAIEASHPQGAAAERADAASMFKFSAYLHVGDGAEDCEHAIDGECEDVGHFHAWCRLPNKFQHRDLYAKANAAKARRLRLLEDPESDASAVLDAELDPVRAVGHIDTIIDDLLGADWAADFTQASANVGEREEYEHILQDRERFMELGKLEAGKSADEESEEFQELGRHINKWTKDVGDEFARIQEPKRESFRGLGLEKLVEQLRAQRVEKIANEVFLHIYNQWEWFIGTMRVKPDPVSKRPYERYWSEMGSIETPAPGSMWAAPPEIIDALQETYDQLERSLQGGVSGNS